MFCAAAHDRDTALNIIVLNREVLIYQALRRRLAKPQAPLLLALLGLVSGLCAGAVILLFRLLVEFCQGVLLKGQGETGYELLESIMLLCLPVAGAVVIILIWQLAGIKTRSSVGVVHVLERLAFHEGHLPLKNAVLQFCGAAVAITSGFSVGREGPAIHLGAATASLLGQRMTLPNNSIRTLVACGSAAAIAASFNTPLAGVIFAMEVVMMEYTIAGFTPVILAAVAATVLSRAVYGDDVAFIVPSLQMNSLLELPYITVMGLAIGLLSVLFIQSLKKTTSLGLNLPYWQRLSLAGFLVGCVAVFFPQVMGIGYDTVNSVLLGEISLALLLMLVFAKLLASVLSIGLAVPGGLIGPTLFIGACAGGVTGLIGTELFDLDIEPGFYAMLGMGAMMSATLHAPLAALLALMEMTGNINIILPGMLALVSANLMARGLFGSGSVFLSQMREMGLEYRNDPVSQAQRRIGVTAVMQESFAVAERVINRQRAESLLAADPRWLITEQAERKVMLPAVDLLHFLSDHEAEEIDLLEIPSQRLQLSAIPQQATLRQALAVMKEEGTEALYVMRKMGRAADQIYGVLTRQDIDNSYHISQ